ncbi:hypothetical protein DXG01_012922 [Tephrocybe rancida]|nr:hypothetical protein DXG01_012922 [Tephrocybe rancida]
MLPDTPMKPLEPLANCAQPLVQGVFDEFDGSVPTAEDWQIRRAKVTGKPADQDLVKKRFPALVDNAVDATGTNKCTELGNGRVS